MSFALLKYIPISVKPWQSNWLRACDPPVFTYLSCVACAVTLPSLVECLGGATMLPLVCNYYTLSAVYMQHSLVSVYR
jgi:hypothetical protein